MERLGTSINDGKIGSVSYLFKMTLGEYYNLSKDILDSNEYQRKRVRNSTSIYSLLKNDLKKGCLMPPIVLALCETVTDENVENKLQEHKQNLKILDGLQRSYTIRDLVAEVYQSPERDDVLSKPLRVEVYTGINKMGILYRMLTLNTGQTPMSTRHQIEIIYSDYLNISNIPGVTFIKDTEDKRIDSVGMYKFRDAIEGFTSYLQQDYTTLDKSDLLENIKDLERISDEDMTGSMFDVFMSLHFHLVSFIAAHSANLDISDLEEDSSFILFGKNALDIFGSSQALTGFGAALASLQKRNLIDGIGEVNSLVERISTQSINEGLRQLLINLDKVRSNARKIGTDQRLYMYLFFRELFNKDKDAFLDITSAANDAMKDYWREVE